jgi:hypothetical protein
VVRVFRIRDQLVDRLAGQQLACQGKAPRPWDSPLTEGPGRIRFAQLYMTQKETGRQRAPGKKPGALI